MILYILKCDSGRNTNLDLTWNFNGLRKPFAPRPAHGPLMVLPSPVLLLRRNYCTWYKIAEVPSLDRIWKKRISKRIRKKNTSKRKCSTQKGRAYHHSIHTMCSLPNGGFFDLDLLSLPVPTSYFIIWGHIIPLNLVGILTQDSSFLRRFCISSPDQICGLNVSQLLLPNVGPPNLLLLLATAAEWETRHQKSACSGPTRPSCLQVIDTKKNRQQFLVTKQKSFAQTP